MTKHLYLFNNNPGMISCQDVNSTYVNDTSLFGDVDIYNTSYINETSSFKDVGIYNTSYVNVSSCVDIKMCNSSYVDGEYWLFPPIYNYTRVKIYCSDLSKKPKDFITLPHLNVVRLPSGKYEGNDCDVNETATTPMNPGETEYHKVKLDILTGNLVDTNSKYTTQISGEAIRFGEAVGCSGIHDYPTCPRRGYVLVDFRQTGFKLSPLNIWRNRTAVTYVEDCDIIEQSTYRFEARGDGYCGGCWPRYKIRVDVDLSTGGFMMQ
ncbi:hypothetical protein SNE40_016357 [Patella caerulea]|uniref:GON domain-containing protein n=1 Tax=Patella caerulea TaxID=87958 RepID=A0AAN8J931_PATCE